VLACYGSDGARFAECQLGMAGGLARGGLVVAAEPSGGDIIVADRDEVRRGPVSVSPAAADGRDQAGTLAGGRSLIPVGGRDEICLLDGAATARAAAAIVERSPAARPFSDLLTACLEYRFGTG
jgi:hypothetical protein